MKKIFTAFLLLLTGYTSIAQITISGTISDQNTGESLPGATIYIPELKTGTVANEDGFYKIANLPGIKVIVQVSFVGYKSAVEKIDLSSASVFDFHLEPASTEVNEVVVTGATRATEITLNPVPMATVNSFQLQQSLNSNIIEAIGKIPGVSTVTTGPNISKPFIHGLGYNRILTLYDGVRQEGQQWGNEHGIEIDENSVDRIEVVKGPASLTYGSDALAGVVNLLPAPPAPNGTFNAHIETNYQSNNNLFGAHMAFGANGNGFVWGAEASHKQATNYKNKYDGRVYGTAFRETDLSAFIGMHKQWGYSDLSVSIFDDLQEVPDGSRDSTTRKFTKQITEDDTYRPIVSDSELNSYKIVDLHQHIQHYKIYSSNNFVFGSSKLHLLMSFQKNVRREYSHPEYTDIPGLYLDLNTVTYDVKYFFPEYKEWETTIGINGMYQLNKNKGTEFIIPDYAEFDAGPFILITKSFDKLNISAGVRYDNRSFKNDEMYTTINPSTGFETQVSGRDTIYADHPFPAYNGKFSGLSASFGVTYNISEKLYLKANIGRGFRAPNIAELSANGVHPGTLIYQIGNSKFKPEFSLQEDLGISYRSDHISGDVNLFYNRISNYIFNQKLQNHLGQDSVIVQGNETFKFQQSMAQLYGVDAFLDIHPCNWLSFENSVSVTFAENKSANGIQVTDSTKYLPLIPPLHTNSELRANLKPKAKLLRRLYFRIGMEWYAKQDRIFSAYGTETPTPGYVLFNAGMGTDIVNSKGKVLLSINIMGNNITNVAYQSHLSRLKYFDDYPDSSAGRSGIYNMGRNISFNITYPLSRN